MMKKFRKRISIIKTLTRKPLGLAILTALVAVGGLVAFASPGGCFCSSSPSP